MKLKLFIMIVILAVSQMASAQYYFSCDERTNCNIDSETGDFTDCSTEEYNCLFELNESMTMFTHTISTMKSTYYVKSSEKSTNDNGEAIFIFQVISDAGNKYKYIFCPEGKYINAVGKGYILSFRIKNAFSE